MLLVEIGRGTSTLEDRLAISYKTKYILSLQASIHVPWYLPKEVENLQKPAYRYLQQLYS